MAERIVIVGPYALVDGDLIQTDSATELYDKIKSMM